MSTREEKKLLTDILESILSIDEHLEFRRSYQEYISNKTKRRATEREFEIIGEAIGKLFKLNSDLHISSARLIIDLRNKVIHAYDSIDDEIIWKIIMKDLPVLQKEIEHLLSEE
jgi:uncharacterized protein with HEPN domain